MKNFADDLRFSVRTLAREPGFAALAVLMLALGIGCATAVFSLVNGALLNPLAYRDPARLVTIREMIPSVARTYPSLPVSARHYVEWRKQCQAFEGIALIEAASLNLTGAGEPERLDAARVSPNLFRVLGVQPALGRDFRDEEEVDGNDLVAVLTDGLWRRRFHADPNLIGRSIVLEGRAHTVIGVLPASFRFPDRNAFGGGQAVPPRTEVFRPKVFSKDELGELVGRFNYGAIGRMKPGVSRQRAAAELEAVQAQMEKLAGERLDERALVSPLLETMVGKARRGLLVLMGAIAVLLLIVCVNLANLVLARGERRNREAAVRAALGAGRGRLMRHPLLETGLICLAGGILAIGVAEVGMRLLIHYAPPNLPRMDEVRLDGRVFAFAGALVALTALFTGLLPAWRAAGADPLAALRSGGRGIADSRAGARIRSALVTCEVGMGALLLLLAGLLMNSFTRLIRADKGFSAPTVLAVDIGLSGPKYREEAAREGFYRRVFEKLGTEPGVQASGVASALPLQGETWIDMASLRPNASFGGIPVNVRFITADYFRTMGISLRGGRTFSDNDRGRSVTIISANLATALWPKQDPVGRKFSRGNDQWFEVVGVVGDIRADAHKPPVAMMYRPYWDWMPWRTVLVARAAGNPWSIAGALRAAIRAGDPDVPAARMRTMADVLDESIAVRRFQMLLAGAFAAMALLVASLGIYAVVSYTVTRRTGELGVRAALGAGKAELYGLVLRQGMAPVAAGLLFAVAGAAAFGRLLENQLYEIGGRDPLTIVAAVALLGAVALGACLIPARRASRVDPMTALRYE